MKKTKVKVFMLLIIICFFILNIYKLKSIKYSEEEAIEIFVNYLVNEEKILYHSITKEYSQKDRYYENVVYRVRNIKDGDYFISAKISLIDGTIYIVDRKNKLDFIMD